MKTLICDTEVFKNYFLVAFKNIDTGRITTLEMRPGEELDRAKLKAILETFRVVTFNGKHFDMPLLALALAGADCARLKRASDKIITTNMKWWDFYNEVQLTEPLCNHVDLIELAAGRVSLKVYGGRLHAPRLQDSPVDFDAELTPEQMAEVRTYCVNDLDTTELLLRKLEPQIKLREALGVEYDVDLRSKSDAQIAEVVIRMEIELRTGERPRAPEIEPGTTFKYDVPHWVCFNNPKLVEALAVISDVEFVVNAKGSVEMPPELASLVVEIMGAKYRMGIGGLHSSEKRRSVVATVDDAILDRDVASYYPNLILNCGLAPEHLGPTFLDVYSGLVRRRLAAKRAGDKVTSDTLKIVLNGTFGKLGNKWSAIYSPKLMIQVTLTGQLALLMLIEMLEYQGFGVLSANTDGVTTRVPRRRREEFTRLVEAWEIWTALETEEVEYSALHSRDVNSYLAVKPDGTTKGKGVFAGESITKNPHADVCVEAVIELLTKGTPLNQTILECDDIRKFVIVRAVKGGGIDAAGNYLGRAVRWIYSVDHAGDCIRYKTNNAKVAESDGARPLMEMPSVFPIGVDYVRYLIIANELLADIGVTHEAA